MGKKHDEDHDSDGAPEQSHAERTAFPALIATIQLNESCDQQDEKQPSSQGRALCNRTLIPARPTAPKKPRGKQQPNVERAAMTAATGVARSVTAMCHSNLIALTTANRSTSSDGTPVRLAYSRQANPGVLVSMGSTSSPLMRIVGEPRKVKALASSRL